jgi:hypothetical protein
MSRVLVPGISIFINASVRCIAFVRFESQLHNPIIIKQHARKSISCAPQILDTDMQSRAANNEDDQLSDL